MTLKDIGVKIGLFSASSISKRINSLEEQGYIRGYQADLDLEKLGHNFMTITFVHAKYKHNYSKEIGKELAKIRGVLSVFFLLGEIDFIVITSCRDKQEYSAILDDISKIEGIERSDTRTVLDVIKNYSLSNVDV